MKFIFTKRGLAITSLFLSLGLIIITEPSFKLFHQGIFNIYESPFLTPLFYWSVSVFVCSILFLFVHASLFESWKRSILYWFLPIGLLLTFMSDVSMSYTFPDRAGVAAILGTLLIVVTIVFVLVQKFVYKK